MEVSTQFQISEDLTPTLNHIVGQLEGLVKQLLCFSQGNPQASLAQLEEQADQLRRECFATTLEEVTQLHRGAVEEEWLLGRVRCECGETPQYKGEQGRTLHTKVGSIRWKRGYFYCRGCGQGRYPLDEALGIPQREQFSEGVQQGVCLPPVQMPFERASHALEVLSGISVSTREAERITEGCGLVLDRRLEEEAQQLLKEETGVYEHQVCQPYACEPHSHHGVWAVALDAGKVRYEDGWHDAKAGVVFWAKRVYNEGGETAGARATDQSYVAEVGSMEKAGERLGAEAWRRGVGPDERVVCLGDGAPSNWSQFQMHFANRVEVLDWYHAIEHLWAAGNGIFGQGTQEAVKWVKRWEGELWEGRVEGVILALHREGKREGSAGEAARAEIHYFQTNKERMRYSQYRAAGYPIGSGTVESACKRLFGARLKGAGMCWSKPGAQGVLTLRAELLSERWDQSWPKTRKVKVA